jgi:Lar family restriction alleviation protein
MATELKPCPFCGGSAILVELPRSKKTFAKCKNNCCEQNIFCKTRDEAIEAWNRRSEPTRQELEFDYEAEG